MARRRKPSAASLRAAALRQRERLRKSQWWVRNAARLNAQRRAQSAKVKALAKEIEEPDADS